MEQRTHTPSPYTLQDTGCLIKLYICRHYRVLSVTEPEWSYKIKKIISSGTLLKKSRTDDNWNTLYTTYTGSVVVLLIAHYRVFHYTVCIVL